MAGRVARKPRFNGINLFFCPRKQELSRPGLWAPPRLGAVILVIGLLFLPAGASAHGTGYKIETDRPTAVVLFQYSSGEPMAYAETLVYSPEDEKVEYQNGRTDKTGRFAFSPGVGGLWKVVVSDGRGHRAAARVEIESSEQVVPPPQGKKNSEIDSGGCSVTIKALLGVSLIFNLGLIAHLFQAGRRMVDE